MIIENYKTYFTLKFNHREDWLCASTYTVLELLKYSIPKQYRQYNPIDKEWIIDNRYLEHIESYLFVFNREEELTGEYEYQKFLLTLDQ